MLARSKGRRGGRGADVRLTTTMGGEEAMRRGGAEAGHCGALWALQGTVGRCGRCGAVRAVRSEAGQCGAVRAVRGSVGQCGGMRGDGAMRGDAYQCGAMRGAAEQCRALWGAAGHCGHCPAPIVGATLVILLLNVLDYFRCKPSWSVAGADSPHPRHVRSRFVVNRVNRMRKECCGHPFGTIIPASGWDEPVGIRDDTRKDAILLRLSNNQDPLTTVSLVVARSAKLGCTMWRCRPCGALRCGGAMCRG